MSGCHVERTVGNLHTWKLAATTVGLLVELFNIYYN
jgi:hypothetical protein